MAKIEKETLVYEGNRINVSKLDMSFTDGHKEAWERFDMPNGVYVVAVDEQHNFYMINEYAVALDKPTLTTVKGMIDKGESPEEAAKRELKEETGIIAEKYTVLAEVYLDPYYSTNKATIVLAEGLSHTQKEGGDEHHQLELVKHPVSKTMQAIASGKIVSSYSISALHHAFNYLQQA